MALDGDGRSHARQSMDPVVFHGPSSATPGLRSGHAAPCECHRSLSVASSLPVFQGNDFRRCRTKASRTYRQSRRACASGHPEPGSWPGRPLERDRSGHRASEGARHRRRSRGSVLQRTGHGVGEAALGQQGLAARDRRLISAVTRRSTVSKTMSTSMRCSCPVHAVPVKDVATLPALRSNRADIKCVVVTDAQGVWSVRGAAFGRACSGIHDHARFCGSR